MLVLDGLGGLPFQPGGKTELETARTPNLDSLAKRSSLGFTIPVAPGVTPGSGPGHLALFGYDPVQYEIGRGAMEAIGVDFELGPDDLAARGNYCTLDANGLISDRRAGRIETSVNQELSNLLSSIKLKGAQVFVEPVKEHRFALILRTKGLQVGLTETDPQNRCSSSQSWQPILPPTKQLICSINSLLPLIEYWQADTLRMVYCSAALLSCRICPNFKKGMV